MLVRRHRLADIEDRFSTWPTERFANRWSKPGFQWGAGMLAGIFLGLGLTAGLIGELAAWGDKLYAFLGAQGLPPLAVESIWIAIKVLAVVHVVLINGLWSIWWERKISAHIQTRVGPTYAGSP